MEGSISISVIGLIAVSVITAIVGGLVGGGGALVVVGRVLDKAGKDQALLNSIEGLANSVPKDALTAINQIAKDLAALGNLVDKVTDGLPNDIAPPPETPTFVKKLPGLG